jgi:hypothetical protein
MPTIVVSGAIANKHGNGGEAWVRLNWVLGFQQLGFDVYFVEQINAGSCVDVAGVKTGFEDSENLSFFKHVTEQFGIADKAALIKDNGSETHGLTFSELLDIAADADLLINISGHLSLDQLMSRFKRKVYVDIDPGFTQFWHADENVDFRVGGHDFYYTIGENIGTDKCRIPTDGIAWRRTRPPVVLDQWPVAQNGDTGSFTTIANWRGPFGSIQHNGNTYGLKLHEFRKFIELPAICPQPFEIALNIHPAEVEDLDRLRRNKWNIIDPGSVASDPECFRIYVQNSKAEFSVAQGVYVSDRTAAYLASGKPTLVQDTGFSRNYAVGDGLIPFRTMKEAQDGADRIVRDYEHHCRAARQVAKEYFDSDKVLRRLIDEVRIFP